MMRDVLQNMMTFNKCSINGCSYGDAYDDAGNPIDITDVSSFLSLTKSFASLCDKKTLKDRTADF